MYKVLTSFAAFMTLSATFASKPNSLLTSAAAFFRNPNAWITGAYYKNENQRKKSQDTACVVERTKYRDSGIKILEAWIPSDSGLSREQITETARIEMCQSQLLRTNQS